jgi:hypothetical protein
LPSSNHARYIYKTEGKKRERRGGRNNLYATRARNTPPRKLYIIYRYSYLKGSGFGPAGEGFVRVSAFGKREVREETEK